MTTKTLRTIIAAATTNAAAATTTGTAVDLRTTGGGLWTAKITNGATGPTTAATISVLVSGDNTNWKTLLQITAGVTNSAVYEFNGIVDKGAMYFRIDVSGNTAQAVTCEAFLQEITTE